LQLISNYKLFIFRYFHHHTLIYKVGRRPLYESVSKSFRTESITKCTLTTINTRSEATQRFMAAKLTRLTQNNDANAPSGRELYHL